MTDKQLIKNCLQGKRDAQLALYETYADTMMGICYRYTKSRADAEDILQEGFIKVFTKLYQFKNEGELGAWMRRIMVNTSISYLHKHNRYKRDLQLDSVEMHPVSTDDPEITLDIKELVELIRTLPIGYQTVFNLVAVEGFSLVEVSKLLESNENTIRSKYSRARNMLIALLKKNEAVQEINKYAERF